MHRGYVGVVLNRYFRCCPWQAARRLISGSAALGLGHPQRVFPLLWAWSTLGRLAVCCLGPVDGAASLCSWCAPTRGFRCGHLTGVSGVGGQLGFQFWAPVPQLGECWGCLSHIHSPGAEGGAVPEAVAAAESSLTSP